MKDSLNIVNPHKISQAIGQGTLKRICNLCNIVYPPRDTTGLMGKPMVVKVIVDKFKSDQGNEIQTNKNGIVELTKTESFPVAVINTDAQTWLINTQEKPDFLWLDYCGGFSFYAKDLDILFAKSFDKMKLILTYNLFDPAKNDENYYALTPSGNGGKNNCPFSVSGHAE